MAAPVAVVPAMNTQHACEVLGRPAQGPTRDHGTVISTFPSCVRQQPLVPNLGKVMEVLDCLFDLLLTMLSANKKVFAEEIIS